MPSTSARGRSVFDMNMRQVGAEQLQSHTVVLEILVDHVACVVNRADHVGAERFHQAVGERGARNNGVVVDFD